jgi:hypothetical protein
MTRIALLGVLLVGSWGQLGGAPQQAGVRRTGVAPPESAELCIVGRVLDATTSRPLAAARVFLYPLPIPDGYRPVPSVTSVAGEFEFSALPAGAYRLGVNKLGFYPVAGSGSPLVTIGSCTRPATADLLMSKGGVVAGRVMAPSGVPLRNVPVGAVRVVAGSARADLVPSPSPARTNERGEYRVESLSPGEYLIVANPGRRFGADYGLTDTRTFWPGTLSLDGAARVTVAGTERVEHLDFRLVAAPTFDVTASVIDHDGSAVADALVTLVDDWHLFGGEKARAVTNREGLVRMPGVPAGNYRLVASSGGERSSSPHGALPVNIAVADADVAGIVVTIPRVRER